jgi:hypothetical protein
MSTTAPDPITLEQKVVCLRFQAIAAACSTRAVTQPGRGHLVYFVLAVDREMSVTFAQAGWWVLAACSEP